MKDLETVSAEKMFQKLVMVNQFHTQDKVNLLNAFKEKYGDEAIEIVEKVECENAKSEWEKIASQVEDRSLESFIKLFWEPLREKGFEFTCEIKNDGIQMKCTKCPAYELAKRINATDWLYHHTCSVDQYIAQGFNPKIGFKRTKTLMQGDEYCDHFYFMK
jgi:predicted ArsR family transcriptional regulator